MIRFASILDNCGLKIEKFGLVESRLDWRIPIRDPQLWIRNWLSGFARCDDVWIKGHSQTVSLSRSHDQRMIPLEDLQVVQVAVVGPIIDIVGDNLGFLPGSLEVILLNLTAKSFLTEHWSRIDSILGVRRADSQHRRCSLDGRAAASASHGGFS